jgi:hypothetical protein
MHLARQEWEHACKVEHYSPIKIVRQVPEIIRVPVDRQKNSTLIIKPCQLKFSTSVKNEKRGNKKNAPLRQWKHG